MTFEQDLLCLDFNVDNPYTLRRSAMLAREYGMARWDLIWSKAETLAIALDYLPLDNGIIRRKNMAIENKNEIDYVNMDIDEIIQNARNRSHEMDARTALDLLVNKLVNAKGLYVWMHLEDAWMLRFPRLDRPTETWLNNELPGLIHICKPVDFLASVEALSSKDTAARFIGFPRAGESFEKSKDGKVNMVCSKCKNKASDAAAKKGVVQYKLFMLSKKTG